MAKGGGSWKVTYADFVTAMMAFFMVMWITAQDQKVKQAVARYFNNPMNFDSVGQSTKPDQSGAVFDYPNSGAVPKSDGVAMGQGRHTFTPQPGGSPPTKMVGDWLYADEKTTKHWRTQAQRVKDSASLSPEVRSKTKSADEVAVRQLAQQMKDEFTRNIPTEVRGVYQDLLFGTLSEVNWNELAQDLLAK